MPNHIFHKIFSFTLISTFIFLANQLHAQDQRCSKKKLASKEMRLEYDYRGQSLFRQVSNGDTISLSVILYSKQNYRIFVVGEQKLGKIDYEIIVPRKKFNRIVDTVQTKTIQVYKKDPNGFYLYNTQGERIAIGEQTVPDTVWRRETSVIKEKVYNSKTSDHFYWEATPSKTQLVTIKVKVENSPKPLTGCIGVYVGREFSNIYQFRR